ncbi:hypothetical protein P154DRAFT_416157, partial [Amniculicola lignicola CBS 123094]
AFDCKDIKPQGGSKYSFGELGGPQIVHWKDEDLEHDFTYNYNFTVDLCANLKRPKGSKSEEFCHPGTRICAIRETTSMDDDNNTVTINPIEIAGTYKSYNNRAIDARFFPLSSSKSHSDVDREGIRAELHGGRFPFDDKKRGTDQMAIIEFVCDSERTGLEGEEEDTGEKEPDSGDDKNDGGKKDDDKKDDDKKEGDDKKKEGRSSLSTREAKCEGSDKKSLRFCGYQLEDVGDKKDKQVKVLRLEWRTKWACKNAPRDADNGSSHWGFFTWFIIILFLATAAYLIFGSWLNYNRYGARGWDLLPHGDTIRDVPYILKDWGRRVVGTIQGPGSRGGYSAV